MATTLQVCNLAHFLTVNVTVGSLNVSSLRSNQNELLDPGTCFDLEFESSQDDVQLKAETVNLNTSSIITFLLYTVILGVVGRKQDIRNKNYYRTLIIERDPSMMMEGQLSIREVEDEENETIIENLKRFKRSAETQSGHKNVLELNGFYSSNGPLGRDKNRNKNKPKKQEEEKAAAAPPTTTTPAGERETKKGHKTVLELDGFYSSHGPLGRVKNRRKNNPKKQEEEKSAAKAAEQENKKGDKNENCQMETTTMQKLLCIARQNPSLRDNVTELLFENLEKRVFPITSKGKGDDDVNLPILALLPKGGMADILKGAVIGTKILMEDSIKNEDEIIPKKKEEVTGTLSKKSEKDQSERMRERDHDGLPIPIPFLPILPFPIPPPHPQISGVSEGGGEGPEKSLENKKNDEEEKDDDDCHPENHDRGKRAAGTPSQRKKIQKTCRTCPAPGVGNSTASMDIKCRGTVEGRQCGVECIRGFVSEFDILTCTADPGQNKPAYWKPSAEDAKCEKDDPDCNPPWIFVKSGQSDLHYMVKYDRRIKLPIFSLYYHRPRNNARGSKKNNIFSPHPCEKLRDGQLSSDDYAKLGYDRGHLTPQNVLKYSERVKAMSNYFVNVAPQDGWTNSGPWGQLENFIKDQLKKRGGGYVVTGVCSKFTQVRNPVTKILVNVPDCFWKLACIKNDNGTVVVTSFYHENTKVGDKLRKTHPAKMGRKAQVKLPRDGQFVKTLVTLEDYGSIWSNALPRYIAYGNGIPNPIVGRRRKRQIFDPNSGAILPLQCAAAAESGMQDEDRIFWNNLIQNYPHWDDEADESGGDGGSEGGSDGGSEGGSDGNRDDRGDQGGSGQKGRNQNHNDQNGDDGQNSGDDGQKFWWLPQDGEDKWERCGLLGPSKNGQLAICDPGSNNFCCSKWGFCGHGPDHCDCTGCVNHRTSVSNNEQRGSRSSPQIVGPLQGPLREEPSYCFKGNCGHDEGPFLIKNVGTGLCFFARNPHEFRSRLYLANCSSTPSEFDLFRLKSKPTGVTLGTPSIVNGAKQDDDDKCVYTGIGDLDILAAVMDRCGDYSNPWHKFKIVDRGSSQFVFVHRKTGRCLGSESQKMVSAFKSPCDMDHPNFRWTFQSP